MIALIPYMWVVLSIDVKINKNRSGISRAVYNSYDVNTICLEKPGLQYLVYLQTLESELKKILSLNLDLSF